jgi:hypothetical protein
VIEFVKFKKIPRYSRECIITEKIDGTNGCIYIGPENSWIGSEVGEFLVGSRNGWITPETDNHGFARWAFANEKELRELGPGLHYGEWWGQGIQRGYGLKEKRFSLFNTHKWSDPSVRPACCSVVPIICDGLFSDEAVKYALSRLSIGGSLAAPGFAKPEGIVIYHVAGNLLFKKTLEDDEEPKGVKK